MSFSMVRLVIRFDTTCLGMTLHDEKQVALTEVLAAKGSRSRVRAQAVRALAVVLSVGDSELAASGLTNGSVPVITNVSRAN